MGKSYNGCGVFSTPVEVFLSGKEGALYAISFLHASGGVSFKISLKKRGETFSPRQWRCFLKLMLSGKDGTVFSTPVEVFL